MANLDKDFDKELDLDGAFDKEKDLHPGTMTKLADRSKADLDAAMTAVGETGGNWIPPVAEGALDLARGVGKGLTLNSVDELGGAASALAERPISYLQDLYNGVPKDLAGVPDDSSILDRYRQNQQAIQGEQQMSADRSPILDLAGQIGGGMTSGSAVGGLLGLGKTAEATRPLLDIASKEGKLKAGIELLKRGGQSYLHALPAIATESALSSKEGGLDTETGRSKLAEDTIGGALFGLPTVLGLQAVTDAGIPALSKVGQGAKDKVTGMIEDSPMLRQMKVAYGYGKEGINPRSSATQLATDMGTTNLAELDNTRVKDLMGKINSADSKIAQDVGNSLDSATQAGTKVDLSGDVQQSLQQLQSVAQKYPELADNTRVNEIFGKIANNAGDVTPNEVNELLGFTDAYIGKFSQATNKTPLDQAVLSNLMTTRKSISQTLKTAVPQYAQAADRMASFRKLVPETILARARPVDVTNTYYGNLKDKDQKMFDALKSLVQGTTKSGTSAAESRTSFVNTIKGMKQFEADDAQRLANGTISSPAMSDPVSSIEQNIKKYSDDAVARGSMDAISPQAGVGSVLKEGLIGHGAETGRSLALTAANKAGLIVNKAANGNAVTNSVAKLGRGIYNAPDDTVRALATKLKGTQGLDRYGSLLEEAVNSGNNNRRNQALFTIMQNPAARAVVGTGTDEEN